VAQYLFDLQVNEQKESTSTERTWRRGILRQRERPEDFPEGTLAQFQRLWEIKPEKEASTFQMQNTA
jgi:hypothetical protein